jgi:hypothetical protein
MLKPRTRPRDAATYWSLWDPDAATTTATECRAAGAPGTSATGAIDCRLTLSVILSRRDQEFSLRRHTNAI